MRLLVIPADAPDPSKRKTIDLVRDEIKLKDQARADIIIQRTKTVSRLLGWITLPSFYADMDKHQKSTTGCARVAQAVEEGEHQRTYCRSASKRWRLARRSNCAYRALLEIGTDRANEGSNGNIVVSSDPDPGIAYGGPLVVLTSRQNASASEILPLPSRITDRP